MTGFDPEAYVPATGLLAITPDKIVDSYGTQLGTRSATYVAMARNLLRYRPTEREIPLGDLPAGQDPTGAWSLTARGEELAAAEADAFMANGNFAEETAALAAEAFPDDPHLQTIATHNATSMLHHAARGFLVLPRRQVYHEFAQERRVILGQRLGEVAASQVLQGEEPQVRTIAYMNVYADLRRIRPQRELLDLTTIPEEQIIPVVQEVLGDTAMLARLLLRHTPQYLTDQNTWPQGAAGLARRILEESPRGLWQALLDAPGEPAETLIGIYLDKTKFLTSYMTKIGDGSAYYPLWRTQNEDRRTKAVTAELDELQADPDVKTELLSAVPGDVVNITERDEVFSKATLARILSQNIRLIGHAQFLDSVALREKARSGMPDFSDTWENKNADPDKKLVADFYGSVRNLRIVMLPPKETAALSKSAIADQIDFDRLVRMAVLVDLRVSSARKGSPPITRVVEVSVFPNHSAGRDLITRDVRSVGKKNTPGTAAVLQLWRESAERAEYLESRMMRWAFTVGPPGSGKRGGSRG
jgi:hypothetical protein